MIYRNTLDPDAREFWCFVDRVADEVEQWPDWKKGSPYREAPATCSECRRVK